MDNCFANSYYLLGAIRAVGAMMMSATEQSYGRFSHPSSSKHPRFNGTILGWAELNLNRAVQAMTEAAEAVSNYGGDKIVKAIKLWE
jgi:hypothetical protein